MIANPHCDQRMDLILKQLEEEIVDDEGVQEENEEVDEVSFIYYGESCKCSKNSMCKSSKCLCFLRSQKCTVACHEKQNTKCSNK